MKVLAVAAHPDDEVLGCGGTLARLSDEGHEVFVAILGEGATSRFARRDDAPTGLVEALRAQSRAVAKCLGVREVFWRGLPDNRFDTVPLLDIVKEVEALVGQVGPELVLTHHGGDLNVDHAVTFRAVLTAVRPQPGATVRELLCFEAPSSTEWGFGRLAPAFCPSVFVDVGATLERKIAALTCYEGERRSFPHPRSDQAIRALAAMRGSAAGLPAAEAFELVFNIR